MAIRVEHALHARRRGRNWGVFLILVALIGIVFGLTVVKVLSFGDIRDMESFDHAPRTSLVPEEGQ